MKRYLWVLLPLVLWGQEDFMSDYEYGQMLYDNPRGVSCSRCHGLKGEGKVIVSYLDEQKQRHKIVSPDIRNTSLQTMLKTVSQNHPIMPRYYLTLEEVRAIHTYLQSINGIK